MKAKRIHVARAVNFRGIGLVRNVTSVTIRKGCVTYINSETYDN
jgi:hypothetical protein